MSPFRIYEYLSGRIVLKILAGLTRILKFLSTILYMFLMASLSGCVPNAVEYYHPTVDGGKVISPHCVPTASIVEFNIPSTNGLLHVTALAANDKQINDINLFFSGNEWNTIQFISTNFQIHDIEKHEVIDVSSARTYRPDGISKITEPYLAPKKRRGLFRFHVQIKSVDPLPSHFELLSPSIVVDGERITFPAIRFEQKLWLGISPFNC